MFQSTAGDAPFAVYSSKCVICNLAAKSIRNNASVGTVSCFDGLRSYSGGIRVLQEMRHPPHRRGRVVQSSDGSVVSFQKTAVADLASVVVFLKTAVAVLMRLC